MAAVVTAVLAVTGGTAAWAADPEGGTKKLRANLEAAAKGYDQAKTKLAASKKRQGQLNATMKSAQERAGKLTKRVAAVANRSYQMGRVSTVMLLLNSNDPDSFVERVQGLDMLAQVDGSTLASYKDDIETTKKAQTALNAEILEQQRQLKVMEGKKKQAETALAEVGGGSAGGFIDADSPAADPAPRNSDGSWPKESCTVDDPTSTGCITPRMLHAYQQARSDGFTHYTVCWSQRSSGEHPKGRACDFSANATTFKDAAATGSDKAYGDRLAAYFVKNADKLGVMYVIWYRQIWMPSTGWRAYSASGGPSVVHTNHVHLSML
ncbi:coiled-coil domain-containing protein [Actinoplanes sp. HUAS TT8]|uniref:coiled-coil domain-containing protein n=1 Tax=Actinoplanes sp. HUAS TT8 TaxID=3447453 RepID=UPI003F52397A